MITADVPKKVRQWDTYCARCKKVTTFIADRVHKSNGAIFIVTKDSRGHEIAVFWKYEK